MAGSAKFEDKGFLGPNQYAKSDNHPTHRGKVTLSPKTLKELNRRYQDGEPVDLEISGWRKADEPKSLKLAIQPAYQKDKDADERPRSRRRDDEDEAQRRSRNRDRDDDDFPGDRPRRESGSRRDYGDDGDL